jgi:CDP-diacylglycerol--glycerol-3-phosphate 3-phosphatidyltransferase
MSPRSRIALPLVLTGSRVLLAPAMLVFAWFDPDPAAFGVCLALAFLSDVFDGILARRLGVATAALRRFDSVADSLFYAATLLAAWHLHASALKAEESWLVLLFALELFRYAFDFGKFRREAAYHLWTSKLWGILLFVGFYALLVWGKGGPLITVPIVWGIVVDLEGLAVSIVLPTWTNDVPSLWNAWRMRGAI